MAGIRQRVVPLATLVAAFALTSCVSEKTVYRDVNGPTPPAAAANFVGYANTSTKQTVCGNCHVDLQTAWVQTNHAKAWQDLQASGHAGSSCIDCHTVSGNGNGATGVVAYSATKDSRYQDVQCENCHGAGASHVANPGLGNRPLPSIAVATDSGSKFGCAGCHTGTHEPFVDQWKISAHNYVASAPEEERSQGCGACHVGQDALTKWGVSTNYVEANDSVGQPITCVVCHDPHAKNNDHQLRFSVTTADTSKNLCMKCHNRSNSISWSSTRGSHAPETGTLFGYAGYFPPGFMTSPQAGGTAIIGTHGSTANPGLCATCHVANYAVNDSKNNLILQAVGHTFNAIPCLDSQGRPLGTGCTDFSQMSFRACTGSGCHGSEAAARGALTTANTRIANLIDQLKKQIAKVPSTELVAPKQNSARGAQFNISVATAGHGAEVLDRIGYVETAGQVAHNPFLIESLLTNSIKAITAQYGVTPDKGFDLTPQLQKH